MFTGVKQYCIEREPNSVLLFCFKKMSHASRTFLFVGIDKRFYEFEVSIYLDIGATYNLNILEQASKDVLYHLCIIEIVTL